MNIKSVVSLALVLFLLGNVLLFAQDIVPEKITIENAVELALQNNLSLRRSAFDIQTRQRTADRAWNSFLPSISGDVRTSRGTALVGDLEPARDTWSGGLNFQFSATFTLATFDNIERAKADYELGKLNFESAKQELELEVRRLFYQILLLEANRELAKINFESAESRHQQSADLVRFGQAPRLDELSARVDKENMRPAMRNTEVLYENALDAFKLILGLPVEMKIVLDGSLEVVSPPLSPLQIKANEVSFETQSLLKSIESMRHQQRAIRSGAFLPNLRLSWGTTPLYNGFLKDWRDSGNSFSVVLGMNFDHFFKWSNTRTQIDNLGDNILSAQIQLTDIEQKRANRIAQHIRTIERIQESLEAMRLNVELAQETYNLYEESYQQGGIDYQQLRSVRDRLEQTRVNLLQENYQLISAMLDLEKELNVPFGTLDKMKLLLDETGE